MVEVAVVLVVLSLLLVVVVVEAVLKVATNPIHACECEGAIRRTRTSAELRAKAHTTGAKGCLHAGLHGGWDLKGCRELSRA